VVDPKPGENTDKRDRRELLHLRFNRVTVIVFNKTSIEFI